MNSKRYQYEQAQQRERSERMKVGQLVKVLSFDEAKGTVDVQPLNKKNTDGTYHVQPPILGVPISGARGGGISMSQLSRRGTIHATWRRYYSTLPRQETSAQHRARHSATDAALIGGVPMAADRQARFQAVHMDLAPPKSMSSSTKGRSNCAAERSMSLSNQTRCLSKETLRSMATR